MLNGDESFEEDGKKMISQEELIDKIYEAIFVKTYEGTIYETTLGRV